MTDERIVPVTMPKWGLSMQLGKITAWVVAEGDEVSVGDDLADIETEKINGTLEAADAATMRRTVPASAASSVPVIFSVSMSARSSPTRTSSPSATTQEVILPSCIDRPHFGIVTGTIRSSITATTRSPS